jgi:hypothetical protein
VSNAAAESKLTPSIATTSQISWLALTLTPGLGPTRARRLVDFFGSIEAVFNASLTELEAAGLPVGAAQSLGTGKSVELAHDEIAKATAAGIACVTLMTPPIHPVSVRSTIPRWCFTFVAMFCALATGDCGDRHTSPNALRHRHG